MTADDLEAAFQTLPPAWRAVLPGWTKERRAELIARIRAVSANRPIAPPDPFRALRLVVPAIMNTFIGAFKDTSLVTIVSLYDLTGALQLALGDADWRKFFLEGQLFVAAIYFVFCFAMSRYSQWIERHLNTGTRRQ